MRCGAGCVLFTSEAITFPFKLDLGMHSINWAELKALAPLLIIALEKGLEGLQVFGDSELKIDWEKGKSEMHNLFLQPVLDQINILMGRFYILPFIHVYKEHNMQADRLSKQNLKLLKKSWCWWKMEGMGIIIKGLFS